MIYKVLINAPAIYEEVILSAGSAEEARRLAIGSAVSRASQAATVTVTPMPDGTELTR